MGDASWKKVQQQQEGPAGVWLPPGSQASFAMKKHCLRFLHIFGAL